MAKIIAPNKKYNGETASVIFVDGVGETADTYLLSWFCEHGYTVEETEPVKKPKSRGAKKPEDKE